MLKFIFFKILFMSAAFTASGALVILCEKIFSRILSRRVIFRLWLVPLILSLVPIAVPSLFAFSARHFEERTVIETDYAEESAENTLYQTENEYQENAWAVISPPSNEAQSSNSINIDLLMIFTYIYFALAIFIIMAHIIGTLRFSYRFRRFSLPCERVIEEDLLKRAGVRRKVALFRAGGNFSPFVCGVFRPKITIPEGNVSPEALLHELIHIKRNDLLFLSVMNFVKAVHFFNPFTYMYSAHMKKAMELSCDEEASSRMDNEERISYSRSLIAYCAPISHSAAYLSENGKYLKERIELVMKNKKRGKCTKIAAGFIVLAIVLFQTAFAAALNDLSPKGSYNIQTTRDLQGGRYIAKDGTWYELLGESRADVINTRLYKDFSARFTAERLDWYMTRSGHPYYEWSDDALCEIGIDMTSLVKMIYDGKVWKALFTVTLDGNIVMENAIGYITNVPDDYNNTYATLYIEDGDARIEIDEIYFDLRSDSILNYEFERSQLLDFEVTDERYLKYGDKTFYFRANEEDSLFDLEDFPAGGDYIITTVPGDKYSFEGDSVSGRFLIGPPGVVTDEFYGTLNGLREDSLTITSEGGHIDITLNGLREWENYYDYVPHYKEAPLSALPFTLRLAADGQSVILTIDDDFTDEWYYSYSSYNSEPDAGNVYSNYYSKRGARRTRLPLSESGGTHNLIFESYNTEPYSQGASYDIRFHISNGKLLFTSCYSSTYEDKTVSGKAAEDKIRYGWLSSIEQYVYDENGNFRYKAF